MQNAFVTRIRTKKNGKVYTKLIIEVIIAVHMDTVMTDSKGLEIDRIIEPLINSLLTVKQYSRPLKYFQKGEKLNNTILAIGLYGDVVGVGIH